MIALITGASSGIGKSMAYGFAARGVNLILVARRKERLDAIKKDIVTNYGVRVKIIVKDLSDEKQCYELHEEVKPVTIDFLINNAGFGTFGSFDEVPLEKELEMIKVNITAVHILTKLFYLDFTQRRYGYILNVASLAGFMAGPRFATYYATKSYVLQLTKALYQEAKTDKNGVVLSALCPGPVNTEFNSVAGSNFAVSGQNESDVAEYAIDELLKGKLIILPSSVSRMTAFASRIAPTKVMLNATEKMQFMRSEKDNEKAE